MNTDCRSGETGCATAAGSASMPAGTSTPAARRASCLARWTSPLSPMAGRRCVSGRTSTRRRSHDGTAFFVDNRDAYLSWVWDIPISPTQTSVGFVLPAERVRDRRRARRHERHDPSRRTGTAPTISPPARCAIRHGGREHVVSAVRDGHWLRAQLADGGRGRLDARSADGKWRDLGHAPRPSRRRCDPGGRHRPIRSTSGDAASTTSTSSASVTRSTRTSRTRSIGPHLRWGLGLQAATYVYTFFAFFMNALHARFDPRGIVGMSVFGVLFAGARAWIRGWTLVARATIGPRSLVLGALSGPDQGQRTKDKEPRPEDPRMR